MRGATDNEGAMAGITVAGIISDGERVLLVRAAAGVWDLPGGELRDEDESVEAALVRALDGTLGMQVEDQEFLETYHVQERGESRPLLRNVSLVRAWTGFPQLEGAKVEAAWVALDTLDGMSVDETARRALREGLGIGSERDALPGAPIILITGPAGAGKSTVARLLCEQLERSAYLSVDAIRHLVVGGYASPIAGRASPLAAAEQNALQLANLAALARNFSLAGYHTVIDTVIESPEELDIYLKPFAGLARVCVVTLLPSPEALRQRDEARAPEARMGERSEELQRIIALNGETRGLRLDSSEMTPDETAAYVLANLDAARVL
jgi:ADP-ribose pyrophosphatase YjhB (NUDIX family)/predicted kinase